MINKDRIKPIFDAIKESGIEVFDDEALIKLLSILTKKELKVFIEDSYDELGHGAYIRLFKMQPIIELEINENNYKIESSEMYNNFCKSVDDNTIRDFITTLNRDELGDLKKILSMKKTSDNEKDMNKLIELITLETKKQDEKIKENLSIK